jgi:hypothetical protein
MRICLISREYPPETAWGGIGIYTYNLSHALAELGHEVHVITQAGKSAMDYIDEKVYLHRILPKNVSARFIGCALDRLMYSYKVFKKLESIGCKFDIVEAPEWGAEGFVYALTNKPLVTRLHTPLFLIKQSLSQKMSAIDKSINLLERTQTEHSSAISSPTKALAREAARSWGIDLSCITVIPNGINTKNIKSMKIEPDSINSEYLVYVGRLEPRKGVHILAKALRGMFEQYPNLKMVFIGKDTIYGNGTMRTFILDINRNYKENIIFAGFVPENKKYSLIKHCKLVVLPSLWENFSYACLESMALGKAIIASKNCGFEEIVEDNISGFLVEPGNYELLRKKIIDCLNAEDKVRYVEKNALKRIDEFDAMRISREFVRYYERKLSSYMKT